MREISKHIRRQLEPEKEEMLHKKLASMGLVPNEYDMDLIDSVIHSAYDSEKGDIWVTNERDNPNPQYDMVCQFCAYAPPDKIPSHCKRCEKIKNRTRFIN